VREPVGASRKIRSRKLNSEKTVATESNSASSSTSADQEGIFADTMHLSSHALKGDSSDCNTTETGRSTQDKQPDLSPATPTEAKTDNTIIVATHIQPDTIHGDAMEPRTAWTSSPSTSADEEGVSADTMHPSSHALTGDSSDLDATETGRSSQDKQPDLPPGTPPEANTNEMTTPNLNMWATKQARIEMLQAFSWRQKDTVYAAEYLPDPLKWIDPRRLLACPPSFSRLSPHPPWAPLPPPWWCQRPADDPPGIKSLLTMRDNFCNKLTKP